MSFPKTYSAVRSYSIQCCTVSHFPFAKHNFSFLHFPVWLFNKVYTLGHPEAVRFYIMYKKPDHPLLTNVPTGFLKYLADSHDRGVKIRKVDKFIDEPLFLEKLHANADLHERVMESPEAAAEELQKFHKKEAKKQRKIETERKLREEALQKSAEAAGVGSTSQGSGSASGKGKKG